MTVLPEPSEAPSVRLCGVRKAYREGGRERTVLSGLDAEFGGGRLSVLFGRSGTGKSTLLNLVSGVDLPDAGQVWVGDVCLTALSERRRTLFRRREIGFVFQFFNLVPTLTVMENLLLPLELNGVRGRPAVERVMDHLRRVGLAGRHASFPDRLSGGEQQRVAIVRAIVHEPRLILADEPTGNLDTETGREILELLTGLVRDRGLTLVMVTHSEEAAAYADRVLELRDAQLMRREPAL